MTLGAVLAEDAALMQEALREAARGAGKTFPNPAVGCVLARGGEVVGRGFHPRAGMPHAEVYALHDAGAAAARGATAYVTLEPCRSLLGPSLVLTGHAASLTPY